MIRQLIPVIMRSANSGDEYHLGLELGRRIEDDWERRSAGAEGRPALRRVHSVEHGVWGGATLIRGNNRPPGTRLVR
jgi:hypothetical protein